MPGKKKRICYDCANARRAKWVKWNITAIRYVECSKCGKEAACAKESDWVWKRKLRNEKD